MRKARKISGLLLALLLCVGLAVMPAAAVSETQDGLEVTLTTDKESYTQEEQITATLTVTNTNETAVSNVTMETVVPEGYVLADGAINAEETESLAAGETLTLTVVYAPEASGDGDTGGGALDDSDDDMNSGDSGNTSGDTEDGSDTAGDSSSDSTDSSTETLAATKTSKDTSSPKTGDDSNVVLWVAVLVLSVGGLVALLVLRGKKHAKGGKRLLSLLLCGAMIGGMAVGTAMPATAAEVQAKSVSVSETVMVGDAALTIEAVVKYDADINTDDDADDDTNTDAGEISFREPSAEHIVLDEATGYYYVDNEILITGQEDTTKEEIEEIISAVDGDIVGCIEITDDYQVEIPEAMTVSELDEIVAQLNENETIDEAMLHYLYEVEFEAVPNDSEWSSEEWSSDYPEEINWGVEAINAMGAWEHYDQMSYVKVGIIDSMFDTSHEDLVYTKVWNNPDDVSTNSPSSYSTPEDYAAAYGDSSHGTHVSGTLAACFNSSKGIAGVAPKVVLYGYSILGDDSDSVVTDSNKTLMGLMEWKYALANLITANCKVINVSMACFVELNQQKEVFGNFLNKLITKGYDFLIVQAAGNYSTDATSAGLFTGITIPAVEARIIIVGAIGTNGSHKNGLFGWFDDRVFDGYYYASFSNYGESVDVVAPGVSIYSAVPGNKYEDNFTFSMNGYSYQKNWDGTSMAAPHVTGIAAMCFSVNSSLTGAQVKSIVVNSATTTVTDTNTGHPRQNYRVADANAAVELALNTQGEAISPVNPATGIVMGNVRGYNDNHQAIELSNVSVSAYRISDYDGNLSEYAAATQSDSSGNYELILEAGQYYINIYKDGYLPFAICDVTVTNDQITYLDNVILIADSGVEASNYIHGTVRNALTGTSIEGVTVQLRPGWDNKDGTLATVVEAGTDAVAVTDSSGKYSLEVWEGCYTAEFIKDGYITGYANVICTNMDDADQDAVLTPVLSDDEYRIVLTWSSTPRDLDSHISGPLSTGDRFHVYYSYKSASDNGDTVAQLDLDDTSSYGPETITLKKTQDGVYRYAVQDFTNRGSTSSTALSMSGAKVELYCGNSLIATYNVPINAVGTVWNVFEIEGSTIRTINTMENNSNPSTVCAISTEAEIAVAADSDSLDKNETSEPQSDDNTDAVPGEDAALPEDSSDGERDDDSSESDEQAPADEPESDSSNVGDDTITSDAADEESNEAVD